MPWSVTLACMYLSRNPDEHCQKSQALAHPFSICSPTKLVFYYKRLEKLSNGSGSQVFHLTQAEKQLFLKSSNDNSVKWLNGVVHNVESIRQATNWQTMAVEDQARVVREVNLALNYGNYAFNGDMESQEQTDDAEFAASPEFTERFHALMCRQVILKDLYEKVRQPFFYVPIPELLMTIFSSLAPQLYWILL